MCLSDISKLVLNAEPSTSLSWLWSLHFIVVQQSWYRITWVSAWQTYACVQTCLESPWSLSRSLAAAIQLPAISQCELSLLMSAGKNKAYLYIKWSLAINCSNSWGHLPFLHVIISISFCCLHLNLYFYLHCFSRIDLCYPNNTQILLLRFEGFFRGWGWCLFAFELSGMHRSCNWFSMAAFIFLDSYHVHKQCLYGSQ